VDESRILKMEERIAWLEKHVLEQDKAMLAMADEQARLKKAFIEMRERLLVQGGDSEGSISAADEKPPHY